MLRAIGYAASAFCLLCSTLNAQQITRLDVRSTSVVRRTPAGERQILHAIVSSASELAGIKIRVGSSAGPLKAEETNLVEADRHIPLAVTGNNEIRFSVRPFGVKTIRLLPVERRPIRPPAHLSARAFSDREVLLSWDVAAEDGVNYVRVGTLEYPPAANDEEPGIRVCEYALHDVRARFVNVHARSVGVCPPWHQGAGGKAWTFCDEITVE